MAAAILEFSIDAARVSVDAVIGLYNSVGFGCTDDYKDCQDDPDYLARLFGPGVYGFFAFDDAALVGMARVFSDDVATAFVVEICIRHDRQRQGVGRALMGMVLARFEHTAIYLDAFPSSVDFFTQFGIKPRPMLVACSR